MIAGFAVPLALAAVLLAAAPTQARAEVELASAWMRPAYAGQPSAAVYVDSRAERPARLVGANVALAKRVELVLVEPPSNDPATHRVVAELPVAGGRETRLALGGSHFAHAARANGGDNLVESQASTCHQSHGRVLVPLTACRPAQCSSGSRRS